MKLIVHIASFLMGRSTKSIKRENPLTVKQKRGLQAYADIRRHICVT